MTAWPLAFRILVTSCGLALACCPRAQATLNLSVVPYNATQLGTGSGVQLGHTVIAGTNLNRLVAGGSFVARCDHPDTGEVPGSRTMTSALIGQYNQLYVTIPDTVPALRNIRAFRPCRAARSSCASTTGPPSHANQLTQSGCRPSRSPWAAKNSRPAAWLPSG